MTEFKEFVKKIIFKKSNIAKFFTFTSAMQILLASLILVGIVPISPIATILKGTIILLSPALAISLGFFLKTAYFDKDETIENTENVLNSKEYMNRKERLYYSGISSLIIASNLLGVILMFTGIIMPIPLITLYTLGIIESCALLTGSLAYLYIQNNENQERGHEHIKVHDLGDKSKEAHEPEVLSTLAAQVPNSGINFDGEAKVGASQTPAETPIQHESAEVREVRV